MYFNFSKQKNNHNICLSYTNKRTIHKEYIIFLRKESFVLGLTQTQDGTWIPNSDYTYSHNNKY